MEAGSLNSALIVFLRVPGLGPVKTRLAASLGPEAAHRAYRSLVQSLLSALSALPNVQLRFCPDDAETGVLPWLLPGWNALAQGPGDLGARLQRAFDDAFCSGLERVVIIGSDCPYITSMDVENAWSALADHDLVLGPAADGGYWLIGLRSPQPGLFQNIPWSSKDVLSETQAHANSAGLRTCLLRVLEDVDTVEEWRRFVDRKPPVAPP